jgi:hypothetical protein
MRLTEPLFVIEKSRNWRDSTALPLVHIEAARTTWPVSVARPCYEGEKHERLTMMAGLLRLLVLAKW